MARWPRSLVPWAAWSSRFAPEKMQLRKVALNPARRSHQAPFPVRAPVPGARTRHPASAAPGATSSSERLRKGNAKRRAGFSKRSSYVTHFLVSTRPLLCSLGPTLAPPPARPSSSGPARRVHGCLDREHPSCPADGLFAFKKEEVIIKARGVPDDRALARALLSSMAHAGRVTGRAPYCQPGAAAGAGASAPTALGELARAVTAAVRARRRPLCRRRLQKGTKGTGPGGAPERRTNLPYDERSLKTRVRLGASRFLSREEPEAAPGAALAPEECPRLAQPRAPGKAVAAGAVTIRRSFAEDFVLGVGATLSRRTRRPGQAADGT